MEGLTLIVVFVVAAGLGGLAGLIVGFRVRGWPQVVKDKIQQGQIYAVVIFVVVILSPGVVGLATGIWSTCKYPTEPTGAPANVPSSLPGAVPSAAVTTTPAPLVSATPVAAQPEPTPNATTLALQSQLRLDVTDYFKHTTCLSRLNWGFDSWVKFVAVFAAFFTTLSSGVSWKQLGIASGAIATAMAGIQSLYPFSDRAQFADKIGARIDNVLSEVSYTAPFTSNDKLLVFIEHERSLYQSVKSDAASGQSGQTSATPTAVAAPVTPANPTSPASTPTAAPTATPNPTPG